MAHNLNIMNNKASMVYVGEVPWHGLGKQFPEPLTLNKAILEGNADYFVQKFPIDYETHEGEYISVPKYYATVRIDTMQPLGVVKKTYQILQNRDAFTIVDDLVGEGAAVIDTLGVLGDGERMWILCKLPENIVLRKDDGTEDPLKQYLLIVNSHDGTSGVKLALTTVRVVCNNTLQAALNNNIGQLIIRHTRNVKERVQNAHRVLGLINQTTERVKELMGAMLSYDLPAGGLDSFVEALFPAAPTDAKLIQEGKIPMSMNHRTAVKSFAGNDGIAKGTLWGAVNGVSEYVDHVLSPIVADKRRLQHNWFGGGAKLKKQAWGLAEELVLVSDSAQGLG